MKKVAVLMMIIFSTPCFSAAEKISLSEAINRMLKYNGEMAAERKDIDFAQGRIDQARAALFPKSELYLLAAPMFKETGNALVSNKDYSKWGVFTNVKMTVIQPIYTFGIMSEYEKAAQKGYEVDTEKVRQKEAELVYRTKQFYYGLQLANDLFDVVKDAKEKMENVIDKSQTLLERNRIKREDLFALKTYYAIVMSKYDEADRARDLARKALCWVMGMALETDIELDYESISPEEVNLKPEGEYLADTVSSRPEIKMLSSGIEATEALWKGQYKQKRPVFFALGYGNLAYTNVTYPQHSSFANDPFNNMSGAVMLGFKFNLDWWNINALSKQSKAEYEKLLVSKDTLTDGMMLQVKKAYREAVDYKKAVGYTKDGQTNANKWMINAMFGYGMGFSKSDLMDSLKAYFEAELNYNMSIYNFNMALADLTKYTGKEVVPSISY